MEEYRSRPLFDLRFALFGSMGVFTLDLCGPVKGLDSCAVWAGFPSYVGEHYVYLQSVYDTFVMLQM